MLLNAFSLLPDDYQLQNKRIDIWEFPLDKLPPKANSLLDEAEAIRANRFYFERHRRRFTVARALLRLILGRYLKKTADQVIFSYNKQGKPQVAHPLAIEFNLSHSRDLALLAIGQQFPLGVDLEFFSARSYDGIAKTLFSPQELQLFLKLPSYLKTQSFFHIWAQKEAFIKACGLGLSYPTQCFTVSILPASPILVADSLHNKEWLISPFTPQPGCSAALCHHPDIQEIRYLRIKNLIEVFAHLPDNSHF
ncbi:4'-phosphopantetheinyl transferase family protein [Legionella fairfieldensis]|uniref:4'-phosphopantetheinyl transferase family protein n=1 Tax=Legionella fairfieldensis TaxID=45064 RepID=UPI00048DE9D8|nr:4'-phosphopantetheinyl transferase superfamily protein [Legionella fairfieldensis]